MDKYLDLAEKFSRLAGDSLISDSIRELRREFKPAGDDISSVEIAVDDLDKRLDTLDGMLARSLVVVQNHPELLAMATRLASNRVDYIVEWQDTRDAIISKLESVDLDEAVNYIFAARRDSPLVAPLLQLTLNKVDPARRKLLSKFMEDEIDNTLGTSHFDQSGQNSAQILLKNATHGVSMEPADLFHSQGWPYDGGKTLEENCRKLGKYMILLNRASKSPVEFSIRGLADSNYISEHNLNINPLAALSDAAIKRFDTVRYLGRSSVEPAAPIIVGTGVKPIVLESLNGQLWRIVENAGSVSGFGLTHPLTLNGRPAAYHKLHQDIILSRCFNDKAQLWESRYKDLTFPKLSTELIKAKITEEMLAYFESLILGEGKKKDRDLTIVDVRKIKIDKKILTSTMLRHVMSQYKIPDRADTEYITTFVAQFEAAYRRVSESFDKGWAGLSIPQRWFKEYAGDELRGKILNEFKTILTVALGEMDKNTEWAEVDESYKLFARRQDV